MSNDPGFRDAIVAEDDRVSRMRLRRALESAGYSVREATNGRDALDLAIAATPSFLITDWGMPTMDGISLCREIRALDLPNYVFTVVLTAREGTESFVTAIESGADDFVTKPVVIPELLARLKAGTRVLALERRLRDLATRDFLTGAFNRGALFDFLDREMRRAMRDSVVSCAIVDLDRFKSINDRFGHLAGDEVLKEAVRRISAVARSTDFVSRFGGEEFCVLLPGCDEASAARWAERCRVRISERPFEVGDRSIDMTASFGVADSRELHDGSTLLGRADAALYRAKNGGRNAVARASQAVGEQEFCLGVD